MRSKLDDLRDDIDEADQQIIEWLVERRAIVEEIAFWKQQNNIEIKDHNREALVRGRYHRVFGDECLDLVEEILGICSL